ncbi:hypothetical protein ACFL5N_00030 [bacterium]
MPAVVLENDYEEKRILLSEIYSTYIEKDIKGILQNERVPAFNIFFLNFIFSKLPIAEY